MISCILPCCVFMFIPHNLMSRAEFPGFSWFHCPCRHELAGGRLAFSPQQRLELFLRGLGLAPKRSRPSSYVTVWSPSADCWFGTFGLFLGIIILTNSYFSEGLKPPTSHGFIDRFPLDHHRSWEQYGAIYQYGEMGIAICSLGKSNCKL